MGSLATGTRRFEAMGAPEEVLPSPTGEHGLGGWELQLRRAFLLVLPWRGSLLAQRWLVSVACTTTGGKRRKQTGRCLHLRGRIRRRLPLCCRWEGLHVGPAASVSYCSPNQSGRPRWASSLANCGPRLSQKWFLDLPCDPFLSCSVIPQTDSQIVAVTEEDEEEDEWEDVSEEEEEEEEEAEANSSQDSLEEYGPPLSCSPLPPRKPRQPPLRSASLREAATTEGVPMTPLGPAEGYEPVSDWGEEMEMCSPQASHSSQSPLAAPREELPADIAGKGQSRSEGGGLLRQPWRGGAGGGCILLWDAAQCCSSLSPGVGPLVPLAVLGSLPMDPSAGEAASAAPRVLEAEIKMDAEMPEPKEVACQARWKKGVSRLWHCVLL